MPIISKQTQRPTFAPGIAGIVGILGIVGIKGALLILLLLHVTGAQAQQLGTLFTTQEERDYLDYLRQDLVTRSQLATFNIQEDAVPDIPVVQEVEEISEAVVNYRFGGIIENPNGGNNVWLNGRLIPERDLPAGIALVSSADDTLLLNIRADGNSFLLKPGQSIDTRSGNVRESYQSNITTQTPVPELPDSEVTTDNSDAVIAVAPEPEPVMATNSSIQSLVDAIASGNGENAEQVREMAREILQDPEADIDEENREIIGTLLETLNSQASAAPEE